MVVSGHGSLSTVNSLEVYEMDPISFEISNPARLSNLRYPADHICTVPSSPPEAMRLPSGDQDSIEQTMGNTGTADLRSWGTHHH